MREIGPGPHFLQEPQAGEHRQSDRSMEREIMTARISNEDESKRTRMDLRDTLVARVRAALDREAHAATGEKRMFGVLAFLHNGNMLGYVSDYGLTVRLAKDDQAAAQVAPFRQRCVVSRRRMPGFVLLDHSVVKTDRQLNTWLQAALDYVGSLPRKEVLLRAHAEKARKADRRKKKPQGVALRLPN